MNSDTITDPSRAQHGLVITPWEFALFKQLTGQASNVNYVQQIDVSQLLDAYVEMMEAYGLTPASREWLLKLILDIKLPIGDLIDIMDDKKIIKYQEYSQTLKYVINIRKHYNLTTRVSNAITVTNHPSFLDWEKYGLVVIMSILDLIAVIIIILIKLHIPFWLIIARSFAAIILTNILFVLIPSIGISTIIPDTILSQGFPTEYSGLYHTVAGIKIFIASIGHTFAHVMQIEKSIQECVNGCTRKAIRIVAKSSHQTIISRAYFWKQFPYYTGLILVCIFGGMAISLLLYNQKCLRFSTNRMIHQYAAFAGFIMTIVHGCQQLLGLNYSYILTLPILLVYCWRRRHTIFPFRIKINRWVVTPTTIRLYLQDNKKFDTILHSFDNVIVYVNYPRISKMEWHPFTLARGHGSANAVITMKRLGAWTNNLATTLLSRAEFSEYINISHYSRSKFRFHRQYNVRYFFCAGVGITGFLAAMSDTIRVPLNHRYKTVLAWSVGDIDLVAEFGRHLIDLQTQMPTLKILIFYSNHRKMNSLIVTHEVRARFNYLQSLIFGTKKIDIATKVAGPICVLFQRVDFNELLVRAILASNKSETIGVFICGPYAYGETARQSVKSLQRNKHNVKFAIWSEVV